MTPKRVLAAIHHETPDRVPTGEWEFGKEVLEPMFGKSTFRNEWARVQALWEGRRDQVIADWKTGLVKVVEHYQWDALLVHNVIGKDTPIPVPEKIDAATWRDADGNTLIYSEETDRFFITKRAPPSAAKAEAPVQAPTKPDLKALEPTASELEVVRHVVRELGKTHFILCAPLLGHPRLGYSDATRSLVEDWVDVYADPEKAGELRLKSARSEEMRHGIATAKREGIDAIAFGCDYGCNTGPFISPEVFRIAVFPGLRAFCEVAHAFGLPAIHHACGNNWPLLDQIVEAGVDVYQSIQPELDIFRMKKRYGKDLGLWGGVPAADLIRGTPDQVRQAGLKCLRACKPGGGFIYGTSHSIMPGAKHENYLAMLAALRECGTY